MTEATAAQKRLRFIDWLREGIRSGLLLRSRVEGHEAGPAQLAGTAAIFVGLALVLERLEVAGPASFDLRGWLIPYWNNAMAALLVWAALWPLPRLHGRPRGVAAWFTLYFAAALPVFLVGEAMAIARAHEVLPPFFDTAWGAWGVFLLLAGWDLLVMLWLCVQFGLRGHRLATVTVGLAALYALGVWQFQDRAWEAAPTAREDRPRLHLSQETFEKQQQVWQQAVAGIAPHREGVVDVYGLVFAPYAGEDVFLREAQMVAGVIEQRFDAKGRVLRLVNHATTADSLPWATPLNLKRAIAALAAKMDREHDVLVVYLTSHGGGNFRLASGHWPLEVDWLTPRDLREALDEAGVRNRVVAVSACYSGGWVGPLANDTTLVMTAADATHTSYGCGHRSPLTFFGRAVFDEQLRTTHSFEQAFAAAVPVIRQREIESRKQDGFSNPQISVGVKIKPVLDQLAARLDGARR